MNDIRDMKLVEATRNFFFSFPKQFTETEEEKAERLKDRSRPALIREYAIWLRHYALRNILMLPFRWIFLVAYVLADFRGFNWASKFQLRAFFTMDCWDLADFPLFVRTLGEVFVYNLIQEVIGPMIYWPLYIFRKQICWVIRFLRGGI